MENVFISEGENTPVTLDVYLKNKHEGIDVNLAVRLPGMTHHYLAKWQEYKKSHRLYIVESLRQNKPTLNIRREQQSHLVFYRVC